MLIPLGFDPVDEGRLAVASNHSARRALAEVPSAGSVSARPMDTAVQTNRRISMLRSNARIRRYRRLRGRRGGPCRRRRKRPTDVEPVMWAPSALEAVMSRTQVRWPRSLYWA